MQGRTALQIHNLQHLLHPDLTGAAAKSYFRVMPRPRSSPAKSVKQLVQQQRDGLYAQGHQNLHMTLPADAIARIDALKQRWALRSRDAVIARIVRQCMDTVPVDALVASISPIDVELRRLSPIIPGDLVAFVKQVQQRFRHRAYGPIVEMMLAAIDQERSADVRGPARGAGGFSARKHERRARSRRLVQLPTDSAHAAARGMEPDGATGYAAANANDAPMKKEATIR